MVNKSPKCITWVQSQKQWNNLGSFPRQTIQHHSNSSLFPNHWCWRSWSWPVLWRPMGFPSGSDGKESACNAGDPGLIPGSGRSPEEGNGYPLQYSCQENSKDGGASRTNTKKKKRRPFHHRGLACKSSKSRQTQNNRQVWPQSKNEGGQRLTRVLSREHAGHIQYPFPTTQEKTLHMDITRWSIPKSDWLCSLQPKIQTLYTVSKNKTWGWM